MYEYKRKYVHIVTWFLECNESLGFMSETSP